MAEAHFPHDVDKPPRGAIAETGQPHIRTRNQQARKRRQQHTMSLLFDKARRDQETCRAGAGDADIRNSFHLGWQVGDDDAVAGTAIPSQALGHLVAQHVHKLGALEQGLISTDRRRVLQRLTGISAIERDQKRLCRQSIPSNKFGGSRPEVHMDDIGLDFINPTAHEPSKPNTCDQPRNSS